MFIFTYLFVYVYGSLSILDNTEEENKKQALRSKLLLFLVDSIHYRAEKILPRLPMDGK